MHIFTFKTDKRVQFHLKSSMMKNILIVLLCLTIGNQVLHGSAKLLDPNCLARRFRSRISGGTTAELNSAPWMVFLHDRMDFVCGGSLITRGLYVFVVL